LQAFRAWINAVLWSHENSFRQHRSGTLSDESWEGEALVLRLLASSAAFRTEWKTFARAVSESAWRDYVDGLIRGTPVNKGFGVTHTEWLASYEQELAPNKPE
jgi:hypothetical protein